MFLLTTHKTTSPGADLAAKRVYKKVEGALPKINETEAAAKIQAPVRALNATKTALATWQADTFTWAKPVGLNKTVNSPLVKQAINKTVFNPVSWLGVCLGGWVEAKIEG